jgi:CHAD domain-containing protein
MNGPAQLASTGDTAGPYLVAKLRGLEARLAEVEPRVLAEERDEDACHDLRVALRRTRTVLEVGRQVLGRFQASEVRATLRDLMRASGALRDEEVLLEVVSSLGVDRTDVHAWIDARKRRERVLRRILTRLVRAGEVGRGRQLLGALLAFRVDPSRDRRLAKLARRAVDRARRDVERRRAAAAPDDVSALHDLRIAFKRLRYTVETFADALPSDLAALAQTAARFQKRLGDVHDVDVAIGAVRRARTLTDEGRADLLAALYRLRVDRIAAYARERGVTIVPSVPPHAVGGVALRKISTR